ncbi:MAG: hypothetical protein CVV51_07070 [Spirochaetae bacterium HGW-Spirochaetae-7]|jgi:anti-anti-sigma regulatory factor|nr:MAG: hypothetical protein CVV51_07070 [Spirochaetae bacterium HGW-Spirochaetae-7]
MGLGSQKKRVILNGAYAIDSATDLARELSDALGKARIIELDLSGVDDLDLPALQILFAAAASAAARGGELQFVGNVSVEVCGKLVSGGFSQPGPLSAAEFAAGLPGLGKAPR